MRYEDLEHHQKLLHDQVEKAAAWDGRDLRDVLIETEAASPRDKAAVAEVFGGPGAGAEFL